MTERNLRVIWKALAMLYYGCSVLNEKKWKTHNKHTQLICF